MGDEQVGQAPLGPQAADQGQDPGLGPDVERASRLVQHQQPGLHAERPGDGHPLPLAAGKLVRVPVRVAGLQARLGQQAGHPRGGLARGHHAVRGQRLGDRGPHPHPRVQAALVVLEHDLHRPPVGAQRRPAQPGHVLAGTLRVAAGGGFKPQHKATFTVLVCHARSGKFGTTSGSPANSVLYGGTAVKVRCR